MLGWIYIWGVLCVFVELVQFCLRLFSCSWFVLWVVVIVVRSGVYVAGGQVAYILSVLDYLVGLGVN